MGNLLPDNQTLDLGKRVLDPRGVYMCSGVQEKGISYILQVYYRSTCLLSLWFGMDGASGYETFLAVGCGGAICFLNKLGLLL